MIGIRPAMLPTGIGIGGDTALPVEGARRTTVSSSSPTQTEPAPTTTPRTATPQERGRPYGLLGRRSDADRLPGGGRGVQLLDRLRLDHPDRVLPRHEQR